MTSKQRRDVVLTSYWRSYCIVCPFSGVRYIKFLHASMVCMFIKCYRTFHIYAYILLKTHLLLTAVHSRILCTDESFRKSSEKIAFVVRTGICQWRLHRLLCISRVFVGHDIPARFGQECCDIASRGQLKNICAVYFTQVTALAIFPANIPMNKARIRGQNKYEE